MRVLVADHSPNIRQLLIERLEEVTGIEIVAQAGDARQTLEAASRTRPHLVTLDIRMPDGGLALVETLRSAEPAPCIAVVSNHSSREYRRRCKALGAVALFDKSSQIDELVDLVEELERELAGAGPSR